MRPATKKFEVQFIRQRNAIERKGVRMAQQAIADQYRDFLAQAERLPLNQWDTIKVSEAPVKRFFEKFYPMSAPLANMTRKNLIQKKADEDEIYLSVFENRMQELTRTKDYAKRIVTITNTTNDRINTVLRGVMEEAELGGFGIDKIRQNLVNEIGSAIRGNVRARAQAIAQTEMISASNQASMFAADSTGLAYRKYWSTSHLTGIRDTHIMAEQDSISRGGLEPDEPFANGLMFPGDPAGDASEVINCRCTVLQEIV
jgi:hypothetical protein